MNKAHSIIAPSSAHRWVKCPGSAIFEAQYTDEPGDAANEGKCAHELGADLIHKWKERDEVVGRYTLHGVPVSDEIYDGAALYAREVLRSGAPVHTEQRISCPYVHLESFGTCDAWTYDAKNGVLDVWELKFGYKRVDAFECWQLLNYATGIVTKPDEPASDAFAIRLNVIQPRDFGNPVKQWAISIDELWPYAERLSTAATDAFSASPTIASGPHCRYCKARHECKAAEFSAFDAAEYVCGPMPKKLTAQQLGDELELLTNAKEQIELRITGVSKQIEKLIKQGEHIAKWDLRSKSHKTTWTIEPADIDQIGKQYGVALTKIVPLTPKQAIEAGMPEEIANVLTQTKPGKKYLVPYSAAKEATRFKK